MQEFTVIWTLSGTNDEFFSDEVEATDPLNAIVELTNELVGEHGTSILDLLTIVEVEAMVGGETVEGIGAEKYMELCSLAEAIWHHVPTDQWADRPPMTSSMARAAANKIEEIMRG
jgi:hypothetical protein